MPSAKACAELKPAADMPAAYHHLHALLQTIRQLAGHEDEICSLLTELRRSGKTGVRVERELAALLDHLPVHTLAAEADSLAASLASSLAA